MPIAQVLALLVQLAEAGSQIYAQVKSASDLAQKLHDENRDATPEEWAALDAAFKSSQDALDAAIAAHQDAKPQ